MPLACVILAAGLGTRMKSSLAKVLHPVAGVPMIVHPVALARELGATCVIAVLGHQQAAVQATLEARFGAGAVEVARRRSNSAPDMRCSRPCRSSPISPAES